MIGARLLRGGGRAARLAPVALVISVGAGAIAVCGTDGVLIMLVPASVATVCGILSIALAKSWPNSAALA